jgi:hypothetical protein
MTIKDAVYDVHDPSKLHHSRSISLLYNAKNLQLFSANAVYFSPAVLAVTQSRSSTLS